MCGAENVCPKTHNLALIAQSVQYPLWGLGQEIFLCPRELILLFNVYWWLFPWGVKLTIPFHLVKVQFTIKVVMKDVQGV